MSPSFRNSYERGEKDLDEFTGEIKIFKVKKSKKGDNTKNPDACSGESMCGGSSGGSTSDGSSPNGGNGGSDEGGSSGGTTIECGMVLVMVPCTGADHDFGDHQCSCSTASHCDPATLELQFQCFEVETLTGDCPTPDGGFPALPPPDFDDKGDPVEDVTAQIGSIASLLGFSNGSNPWMYFSFHNELRSQVSSIADGCTSSDTQKANDILEELRNAPSFENQEELRFLMHKATDSGFSLSEVQHKEIFDRGLSFDESNIFDDLWKKIKEKTAEFVDQFPQTPEEWEDLMEILREELFTIETLAEIGIPGLADFKNAIANYQNGNGWGAAWDVSIAVLDLFPGKKALNATLGIANKVRRSSSLQSIYRTVKSIGNTKVYNGFKKSALKEIRNPHIFRVAGVHIGHPDFDY
jgi:hypothetical protein